MVKVCALCPAVKYGGRLKKRSLEYTDADNDAFLAAGNISESWSREYLPT